MPKDLFLQPLFGEAFLMKKGVLLCKYPFNILSGLRASWCPTLRRR